jgi:CRP-like cAMP-binding protein
MTATNIPLDQIEALSLFEGLPKSLLQRIASASSERRHDKDSVIFFSGDRPKALFGILSGTVKAACQSSRGGEKVIDLLGPGRLLGESALILDCPYPYLAAAATPVRLLQIDGRILLELLETSPTLSLRLAVGVSQSIGALMRDLEGYMMLTTHKRVARFLMDQRTGTQPSPQPVHLPVPKHLFASRLGMTAESLSRTMRDLAEAGVIRTHKRSIRVIDGQRLAMLAA